eukprot:TRINITY_DN59630_c0_g1_i1.p1 TRINITY_DN59630_c0_g1~~TRINITY_DN59630_c0_g1_i1.p1  ORF type:complete len:468 (-),score=81.71 TRINITY_DN59630_c0_g1_i1:270-1673(-)
MGSGSSIGGLQGAVRAASTNELQAALAGLEDAERARLVMALQDGSCTTAWTLPATLYDVDAEFVTVALKRSGYIQDGTRIASLQKVLFDRKKGYLGDKCLLKDITYEPVAPEAPSSVFVKLFPTDLVIPAAACARMWQTEVSFVSRLLKELPDSSDFKVPQFYFADTSPGEDDKPPRFVILMEPISAEPYDILTAMPVERALRTAKDLAIMHAPYWGWTLTRYREEVDSSGLKKFEAYGHMEDPGKQQGFIGPFIMGAKMGLEVFGADGPLSAAQREAFSGYVEFWSYFGEVWPSLQKRWPAVFSRWAQMPVTLAHGDLHIENMFCLEDGTNVYIDFQGVNLGPGVRDLAWLLASSLKAEERREHEAKIVEAYNAALVARGVTYDLKQCWDDFVFMKLHGLFAGCLGAGIFAGKDFKAKTGVFAEDISEDSIAERARNNVLFSRVVDDLRHSNWLAGLEEMPEDTAA